MFLAKTAKFILFFLFNSESFQPNNDDKKQFFFLLFFSGAWMPTHTHTHTDLLFKMWKKACKECWKRNEFFFVHIQQQFIHLWMKKKICAAFHSLNIYEYIIKDIILSTFSFSHSYSFWSIHTTFLFFCSFYIQNIHTLFFLVYNIHFLIFTCILIFIHHHIDN